ncbi:MAG: radical SAM protein [Phycisphaerae bacterium]
MDALLIVAPWGVEDGHLAKGTGGRYPPLGLLYVAGMCESRGHSVRVIDAIVEDKSYEDIEASVRQHQPRFVGLTSVTTQIHNTQRVAAMVKRVSPDSKVVVGGSHASVVPAEVMQDANIDYVIRGEGEYSFTQLVGDEPLESILGLSYRSGGGLGPVRHNPAGEPIMDLDALPMPAYHLTRFELYRPSVGSYKRLPAIAMMSTRGCPGKCTFCSSAETALRTRSSENIVNEIETLQGRYGVREINFYDDTFTIFKNNVVRFCDLVVERGIDLTWSCFARVDCVSKSLLKKMRAAGCHQILYGVESADPLILKNIGKDIDLERTRTAVRMTRKAGIGVRCTFMFGNPGETVQSMRRTIDFAKELNPDIAMFNITAPIPGTKLYDWAKRNGHLLTDDWRDYDAAKVIMELPTVSNDEVNRMYRTAYHEFYLRPRYLLKRLMRMRNLEDVKMSLRAIHSILTVRTTNPISKLRKRGRRDVQELSLPVLVPAAADVC